MTAVQATPDVQSTPARDTGTSRPQALRLRVAQFWVQTLVGLSHDWPEIMHGLRGVGVWFVWNCSPKVREATRANAGRILGDKGSPQDRKRLAKAMIGSFYDFLLDIGRHKALDAEQLVDQVESIQGADAYAQARSAGKGAILVTAHLGSFEVGAAVLKSRESRVHVVFQRDPMPVFERLRSDQHRRVGLIEAPVNPASGEDAWNVWLGLRDALLQNEVVLMQGDRVMPGQRGSRIPFLGGHIVMPPGPVKLALATGAPIIPVCSPRTAAGRVRIIMEEPIWVTPRTLDRSEPHPAELQLAKVLERWLSQFADQWMMVQKVWCEDAESGTQGNL